MFLTPHQSQKRVPLREIATSGGTTLAPRQLISLESDSVVSLQPTKDEKWSNAELKALVEFLLFYDRRKVAYT